MTVQASAARGRCSICVDVYCHLLVVVFILTIRTWIVSIRQECSAGVLLIGLYHGIEVTAHTDKTNEPAGASQPKT